MRSDVVGSARREKGLEVEPNRPAGDKDSLFFSATS